MILFRCSCGKSHSVEDQYAGGGLECPCGVNLNIPQQSEPNIFLIYKNGEVEDGIAMSLEELQAMLARGKMSEIDLVRKDGLWIPLRDVFDIDISQKENEGLSIEEDIIDNLEPIEDIFNLKEAKKKSELVKNKRATGKIRKPSKKKSNKKRENKEQKEDIPEENNDDNNKEVSAKENSSQKKTKKKSTKMKKIIIAVVAIVVILIAVDFILKQIQ